MTKLNQVLLSCCLVVLMVAAGWYLAKETLILQLQLERRAAIAEAQLQQLQKAGPAPVAK